MLLYCQEVNNISVLSRCCRGEHALISIPHDVMSPRVLKDTARPRRALSMIASLLRARDWSICHIVCDGSGVTFTAWPCYYNYCMMLFNDVKSCTLSGRCTLYMYTKCCTYSKSIRSNNLTRMHTTCTCAINMFIVPVPRAHHGHTVVTFVHTMAYSHHMQHWRAVRYRPMSSALSDTVIKDRLCCNVTM